MSAQAPAQPRRRGLVLPLLFIGLGALLLAERAGLVGLDLWQLVGRFWPLLLIALGLELALGGTRRAAGAAAVVGIIGVCALAWVGWMSAQAQAGASLAVSRGLEGAREAEVHLAPGVARLRLEAGAAGDDLIVGTARAPRGKQLEERYDVAGGRAVYRLQSARTGANLYLPGGERAPEWTLALNPALPIALSVESGVGRLELDLERLTLSALTVRAGVGETEITLPAQGQLSASISSGVGATTLHLPRGVAARISASRGLGSITVRGDFERRGDVYLSPGYDGAQNRIDLRVESGIGSIEISSD